MDPGWTGFNFFLEWLTYRFSDSLQHGNSSKEADFFTTLERKLFFKIRGLCLSSPFYFYSIPKSTFTPPQAVQGWENAFQLCGAQTKPEVLLLHLSPPLPPEHL